MKFVLTISLACMMLICQGQKRKTYFPVWSFHQKNAVICGLSLGLWNFSDQPRNTSTNGIRLALIGEGLLVPLIPFSPIPETETLFNEKQKEPFTEKINGLNIAGTGTAGTFIINGISLGLFGQIVSKVNGFSASLLMNYAQIHNGIQIAAINEAYKMKGLQLGIINRSKETKGIQIGFWNVNERRKLPLINWNFRKGR